MRIISHRGVCDGYPGTSLESFAAVVKLGVDAIEFDVRVTKDSQLVILHDPNTTKIANKRLSIRHSTLQELRQLKLKNGQTIITLPELLKVIDSKVPVVVDIKATPLAETLIKELDKYPNLQITLTGMHYKEMAKIRKQRPNMPLFVQCNANPLRIMRTARRYKAVGISISVFAMNPLTYFLARRAGLTVRVWTVNSFPLAWVYSKLYPQIEIFTDEPRKMLPLQKD